MLSRDAQLGNGDDLVIGQFEHQGLMPVGSQYTQQKIIKLPPRTEGRFTLFVNTDATDAVYEHTNTRTNVASPAHLVDVTPIPYADLQVDTVVADANGVNSQPLKVTWSVSNQGIGNTNMVEWRDTVRIARDQAGQTGP
ncbi:MAG: hypothetical protein HYU88_11375, partial [Chloroflexi bacterium]|nr:hypothetical protein [Chloroflexota bacterium]